MNRTEKEQMIASLAEVFNSADVGFLVDYRGLTVSEITELRRRLHESATQMRVLKNRIAKLALKGTPFEPLSGQLTDTRALIFGTDAVAPAKVVSKYLGENEKFKFISGFLVTASGGSLLDTQRVKALGDLPSREELLIKLLYVMQATQTQLVRTLNEVPGKFVRTLAAIAESKKGQAA